MLGIGTMWESNVIVNSTDCSYLGKNGNRVYQELSGCPADVSLPIQASTQSDGSFQCGAYVQNACFGDELMTTRQTQPSVLSNVTIALLEDLGYKVDYSQAAPYTREDLAPFCVCDGNGGSTRMLQEQKEESSPPLERPRISDRGRFMAIEYAEKELKRMNEIAASYMMNSGDNATVGVPGMTVMFVDGDGVAHSMYVRNKWA